MDYDELTRADLERFAFDDPCDLDPPCDVYAALVAI